MCAPPPLLIMNGLQSDELDFIAASTPRTWVTTFLPEGNYTFHIILSSLQLRSVPIVEIKLVIFRKTVDPDSYLMFLGNGL